MILEKIIEKLELAAPEDFAQSWDNVGLLVGDRSQEINKIFIALDADDAAIAEAKNVQADLLLTHHPLIFSPLKKITTDDFISARVVALLQAGIACYAMHTNFDAAQMGILAAERMGLSVEAPLGDCFTRQERLYGIGAVGELKEALTLGALAEQIKRSFALDSVKVFGDLTTHVRRAALCPGAGKSMVADALRAHAQVYVTGDIDHHTGIDAVAQGLCIIDAGHYGIEHIFISEMEDYLKRVLPEVTVIAQKRRDPFVVL